MSQKQSTINCPPAPVKVKQSRMQIILDQMVAECDDCSMNISQLRRQLDRAYADWYAQKKEIVMFCNEHALGDDVVQSLRTEHFNKKRKYVDEDSHKV